MEANDVFRSVADWGSAIGAFVVRAEVAGDGRLSARGDSVPGVVDAADGGYGVGILCNHAHTDGVRHEIRAHRLGDRERGVVAAEVEVRPTMLVRSSFIVLLVQTRRVATKDTDTTVVKDDEIRICV